MTHSRCALRLRFCAFAGWPKSGKRLPYDVLPILGQLGGLKDFMTLVALVQPLVQPARHHKATYHALVASDKRLNSPLSLPPLRRALTVTRCMPHSSVGTRCRSSRAFRRQHVATLQRYSSETVRVGVYE